MLDITAIRSIRRTRGRADALRRAEIYPYNPRATLQAATAIVLSGGYRYEMFCSYSYLGLHGHPDIQDAAMDALDDYGTGAAGVRMLAGTLPPNQHLDETIAAFAGRPAALTFSAGYMANVSVIAGLVGPGDHIFSDTLAHSSIIDGCVLSGATVTRFRHNDAGHLADLLERAPTGGVRLVITEGVFSMDGDIGNLPELHAVCDRWGAALLVDEAHSIGVLGATGRGIEEHFGMPGAVDILTGTFSKAFAGVGGYVAASADLIDYYANSARGHVFSAPLTPPSAAAAAASIHVVRREPNRVATLRHLGGKLRDGLRRHFSIGPTATPIVPVIVGPDEDACRLAHDLRRKRILVQPVIYPAVPIGTARLRTTVTAAHSEQAVEHAVAAIAASARPS